MFCGGQNYAAVYNKRLGPNSVWGLTLGSSFRKAVAPLMAGPQREISRVAKNRTEDHNADRSFAILVFRMVLTRQEQFTIAVVLN